MTSTPIAAHHLGAGDFSFVDEACLSFRRHLSRDSGQASTYVLFYLYSGRGAVDVELANRNGTLEEKLCIHVDGLVGLDICFHMHELTYTVGGAGKLERYKAEVGVSPVLEITSDCPTLPPLLGSFPFKRFDLLRYLNEI